MIELLGGGMMTVRDILKMLHKDGWTEIPDRTKGSHIQLKHPYKPGKVTVPNHSGDIPLGTLNSIKKQAGLK
jgi:predicted RNA binding protein YcfA (HicA-like mRNA interferase family)